MKSINLIFRRTYLCLGMFLVQWLLVYTFFNFHGQPWIRIQENETYSRCLDCRLGEGVLCRAAAGKSCFYGIGRKSY